MCSVRLTLAAVSLLAIAAPAAAVQYRFDVFDPTATQGGAPLDGNTYTFFLDSSPTPVAFTSDTFSLTTDISYSAAPFGAFTLVDSPVSFLTDNLGGGLNTVFNLYFGPQLFTGTTDAPTFLTGTFDLDVGSITITAVGGGAGAVPEPATWAMMAAGFGLVGFALRARRTRVAFG